MCTQWNDKVVNAIRGVVRSQNDGLVLPLILLGIAIAAVLTDLERDRETEREIKLRQDFVLFIFKTFSPVPAADSIAVSSL